jgi:nitroreductase
MDFDAVVRGRRMVRAFRPDPIAPDVVARLLDTARRAPSAGNTQGTELLVLEGREQTARFWDASLPRAKRNGFAFPHLLEAPVIVLPFADRRAYLDRYGEPDKARTGLADADRWPVPYWLVDTSFVAMTLMLAVENEGLGALFFGVFHNLTDVLATFAVPHGYELVGAIAIGHPLDDVAARPGRSAGRGRRPLDEMVHRGHWLASGSMVPQPDGQVAAALAAAPDEAARDDAPDAAAGVGSAAVGAPVPEPTADQSSSAMPQASKP